MTPSRWLPALLAVVLCACDQTTGAQPVAHAQQWVRTDGRPVDELQLRSVMAQCKGEAAVSVKDVADARGAVPWATAIVERPQKEATILNACMARNGYVVI